MLTVKQAICMFGNPRSRNGLENKGRGVCMLFAENAASPSALAPSAPPHWHAKYFGQPHQASVQACKRV